jgi:FkbM family methyltransferase
MEFFSQNGEDKHIYEKYLKYVEFKNPVYLEMGAMDGISYSNTYFLEKYLNWHGILIEPHPLNFNLLKMNRPNNKLFNNIVSNSMAPVKYLFYNQQCLSGVAGIKDTIPAGNMDVFYLNNHPWYIEQKKNLHEIELIPVTLSHIIKESGYDHIDFLSLDVEGHEYHVLESFDWSIPINILLIENNPDAYKVAELLKSRDYIFIENVSCNSLWFSESFKKMIDSKIRDLSNLMPNTIEC